MKLLIIRHADPDYSIDSLTATGWKEAEALSERMEKTDVTEYFVSPLGRAQDTANVTLRRIGRTAETLDWLREFDAPVKVPRLPDYSGTDYAWDWFPEDWTARERFFDKDNWLNEPEMAEADMKTCIGRVCEGLDGLLEKHGYRRDGLLYRAAGPNHDTLAFFCHFGLECVLLGHLLNISPMSLWHGACAAPSSVTTVVTEERKEGTACFRVCSFGDISHLYVKDMQPSFHARFCECFTDGSRH